jgi:hypothetical protein
MWPEFIRKLTILLIYDRLNSKGFSPKSWKPGSWFQSEILNSSTNYASQNKTGERTVFTPNMARLSTAKRNLFPDESALQVVESNNLFDVNLIMSQNMSLDNYKPHDNSDFGSYQYTIRSKNNRNNNNNHHHHHHHHHINNKHEILLSEDEDEIEFKKFHKFDFNSKVKILHKKQINKEASINLDEWVEKSLISESSNEIQSNNQLNENLENHNKKTNQIMNPSFEYSKVTDNIYKTFGRVRKPIDYPQQVTIINKIRPIKNNQESSLKNFYIPDLIENIKYTKHYFTSDKSTNSVSNNSTISNPSSINSSDKSINIKNNNYIIHNQSRTNKVSSALTKIQLGPLF